MRHRYGWLAVATGVACSAAVGKESSVEKTADLRQQLTTEQYHVTQEGGTERPFQNAYWNEKRAGIYVDVVSGEPLFGSQDKFDSGTGWPSFLQPLVAENIVTRRDPSLAMERTEVRSRGADSHLGHLFSDGPPPTHTRYCINSAALRFIPEADLVQAGYGAFARPQVGADAAERRETATFAGGCFWCIEAAFAAEEGVIAAVSGYMGGQVAHPSYEQVCGGNTGHAEVVQVTYDPQRVAYAQLLDVFWRHIDPTTRDRQFFDVGSQYRTAIFVHNDAQREVAEASRAALAASARFRQPIVTEIVPATTFYPAEAHHQGYYRTHPEQVQRYQRASGREAFLRQRWPSCPRNEGPGP